MAGAPGGLFAQPHLGVSSWLPRGRRRVQLNGSGFTTYALAGMGAFFSVVSKVPITAIVIVFEMTTDFNLVLPLMGSVTAYLVAESVALGRSMVRFWVNGIYGKKLRLRDFGRVDSKDVMQPRVETLSADDSG